MNYQIKKVTIHGTSFRFYALYVIAYSQKVFFYIHSSGLENVHLLHVISYNGDIV